MTPRTLVIFIEAWLTIVMALAACVLLWRNARHVNDHHTTIRYIQIAVCASLAFTYGGSLLRLLPSQLAPDLVVTLYLALLATMAGREIIERL